MERLGQVLSQFPGFSGSGLLFGEFACPKAPHPRREAREGSEAPEK